MPEKEQPILWVVGMVMLVIAFFGWAFMAANYAHSKENWRGGGIADGDGPPKMAGARNRAWKDFLGNAVKQIPNAGPVFGYAFENQIWLPILIAVLEALAVGGGVVMWQVQKSLDGPTPRRRPAKF